jgi:putative phosphoribosyl transferase
MFADRTDAGQQLARALAKRRTKQLLVLGLPRGGVIVAAAVANALGGDLDVMLVKKLRAPGNPELAIGAVSEDGRVILNDEVARLTGANQEYVVAEGQTRFNEMAEQRSLYRSVKSPLPVAGRVVMLVDDGLATGSTMAAAVQAVMMREPQELIVAVPVGPPPVVEAIRGMAGVSAVVCLVITEKFHGVGQFYHDFRQTSDAEVVAILENEKNC